jgi:hypothetical protein
MSPRPVRPFRLPKTFRRRSTTRCSGSGSGRGSGSAAKQGAASCSSHVGHTAGNVWNIASARWSARDRRRRAATLGSGQTPAIKTGVGLVLAEIEQK